MSRPPSHKAQKPRTLKGALPALSIALLVGVLLAGCGSSDAQEQASSPRHHAITFPIRHETHEDIVAAVEACREGVDLGPWLTKQGKADLYETCDKGLKRGLTEVRQYGEQVCGEVVFTMPGQEPSERQHVLEVCEAKTKKFAPHVK